MADQSGAEKLAELLRDAFDRPIAFHRVFVKLTDSVTAALMLSRAMYWSKRSNSKDGWFFKTRDQWEEETGLSRFEQETARKTLRKFTFWKEELRGVPAQMFYRIDTAALARELRLMAEQSEATISGNK